MFPSHCTIHARRSTLASDERAGYNEVHHTTPFHGLPARVSVLGTLTSGRPPNVFCPSFTQICSKRLGIFSTHFNGILPLNCVVHLSTWNDFDTTSADHWYFGPLLHFNPRYNLAFGVDSLTTCKSPWPPTIFSELRGFKITSPSRILRIAPSNLPQSVRTSGNQLRMYIYI